MSLDKRIIMPNDMNAVQLEAIVKSIFTTMMGLPVEQGDASWLPDGNRLTSIVYLDGDWNGAISLACSALQACEFAGRILSLDPPDTVDDDVRDVLGELANMIGGNVKSAMATGVRLSIPSVMDGDDHELQICGAYIQDRLAFRFAGGDFWVTIINKQDEVMEFDRVTM
jgi:chemotaxis protein CheX